MGAQAVSGAMSGYATYQAGKSEEEQLAFERDRARQLAIDATTRGASDSARAAAAGTNAVSENQVALAGSGVDVQSGTALDILEGTRAASALDVETIRNNARREAWGHKTQADQFEYGRKMAQYNRQTSVLGSFLGTAASMGATYAMSKAPAGKKVA
jgi:hypothetical protein